MQEGLPARTGLPADVLQSWAASAPSIPGTRRVIFGKPRTLPEGVDRVDSLAEVGDGTVYDLLVYGIVERAPDLVVLWREVYRVLAPGGRVRVFGVHWLSVDCCSDPTRVRGLSDRMFLYLSKDGREALRRDPVEDDVALDLLSDINLDLTSLVTIGEPEWDGRSDEARAWGVKHYANVVRRLDATLQKT